MAALKPTASHDEAFAFGILMAALKPTASHDEAFAMLILNPHMTNTRRINPHMFIFKSY
jgi:hypothetical protein